MKRQGLNNRLVGLFTGDAASVGDRWRLLSTCLLAFSLPLAPMVLPLFMALVVLTYLVDTRVWRMRPLLHIDLKAPATWAALLLVLHVVGMLWTRNTDFGWFDIGIKLPLLVLPLLAFFRAVEGRGRDAVLFSFCAGNMAAVLLCLFSSVVRVTTPEGQGAAEFLSSRFSVVLHPSYFAWYLVTALACYFLGGLKQRLPRSEGLALVGMLSLGLLLTGSRMGWITLPILLVWALVHNWRDRWIRGLLVTVLSVSVLAGALLTAFSAGVRYRVMELFAATDNTKADATGSAAVRTVVWGAAWDVAMYNLPFGTGTGDVKDELLLRYKEIGATHAEARKLNAHDQFLQTFAALGVPGAAALVFLFLFPLFAALRGRVPEASFRLCVLLLLFLNLLVESMLEVQAGALATGFLLWVLWWPRAAVASSHP